MGLSFAPRAGAPAPPHRDPRRAFYVDHAVAALTRRRWMIAATVTAALLAALAYSLLMPREYRASAILAINAQPESILGGRGQPAGQRTDDQYMLTQLGLLRSRSLAERVAKDLKLDSDPDFAAQSGSREQRRHAAAFTLMDGLDVRPLRGSDLIELAYVDRDRGRAARIANAFAAGFIAETTEDRYDITAYARAFLRDRLADAQSALERSERAVVDYARSSDIVELAAAPDPARAEPDTDAAAPAGGDSLTSHSLVDLNAALSKATADRIAAEQTYRQVATGASSEAVADPALQALRGERARLEADYRERLNTFQPDYPDMAALRGRIDQVQAAIARENGSVVASLRGAYQAALGRERALAAKVAALRAQALDLRDRGIGYTMLQREAQTNRELYQALLHRYKEIGVVGELGENHATVVDAALPPAAPFRPQPLRNLAWGLIAGLTLGVALAFLAEFLDDTVKSPEDVAGQFGVALLGVTPQGPKGADVVAALNDPGSPLSESSHSIATALRFVGEGGLPASLLVTSSRKNEGKSSVSLALAMTLARSGRKVLLIDGDLRDPSFTAAEQASEVSPTAGMGALLANSAPLADAVAPSRTPNLYVLPVGPRVAAPAQLLATVRIRELIDEAERAFEVTIIDAPPVLALADAPILAATCAATVFVIEANVARRAGVHGALRRLELAGAVVVGAVMTKFQPTSELDGEHYGYGYADAGKDGGWAGAARKMRRRGDVAGMEV